MGARYEFQCKGCGYTAVVSGGPDLGFFLRTQTAYCTSCKLLIDVPGETLTEDQIEDQQGIYLTKELTCDLCGNTRLNIWRQGDPCPRCGGAVVDTGRPVVLWD
jgi:hypothetical protein